MSTITVNIPENLKNEIQKKAKEDWVNLTFVINNLLKSYRDWKAKIWMFFEEKNSFEKRFEKNLKSFFKDLENWTLEKKLISEEDFFKKYL